jgi:hypothetical protein
MSRARAAAVAALVVVVVAGIGTAREWSAGHAEIDLADTAVGKSDWPGAIAHARAAAEALVPGSPWPARGWQRLEAIGHDAEARGDDDTALLAYGAMRTAALATRSPFSAGGDHRARAEEGLARVATSGRSATGPQTSGQAMLDALRESDPPTWWLLAALGVAGLAMAGGLARLAWLGKDAAGARAAQIVAAAGLLVYAAVALVR